MSETTTTVTDIMLEGLRLIVDCTDREDVLADATNINPALGPDVHPLKRASALMHREGHQRRALRLGEFAPLNQLLDTFEAVWGEVFASAYPADAAARRAARRAVAFYMFARGAAHARDSVPDMDPNAAGYAAAWGRVYAEGYAAGHADACKRLGVDPAAWTVGNAEAVAHWSLI